MRRGHTLAFCAVGALALVVAATGYVSYKTGLHEGYERGIDDERQSRDEVRALMKRLGACDWAERYAKELSCPVLR